MNDNHQMISTSRFGTIQVSPDNLYEFPGGLFGFPDCRRVVLIDRDSDAPFLWLQSVDDGNLAFVLIDPTLFDSSYAPPESPEVLTSLECPDITELVTLAIVGIPDDVSGMTANLKGPILLNPTSHLGRQIIHSGDYSSRVHILDAIQSGCRASGST